jgi:hypothetical protein
MGRAFRVVKRTAHLTVQVAERPAKIATAAPEGGAKKRARGAAPKRAPKSAAKAGSRKAAAKNTTAKSRAAAATE